MIDLLFTSTVTIVYDDIDKSKSYLCKNTNHRAKRLHPPRIKDRLNVNSTV